MKSDRLQPSADPADRELADAFRSVRDAYDGTSSESNTTLQRALFQSRARKKRQRLTRWVVLPAAAALVASTAWAGVTGRLTPAVRSMIEVLHDQHGPRPAEPAARTTATALATTTTASPTPVSEPALATVTPEIPVPSSLSSSEAAPPSPSFAPAAPQPKEARASAVEAAPVATSTKERGDRGATNASGTSTPDALAAGASNSRGSAAEPIAPPPLAPSPSASAADPHAALFAEAHRLHFTERDPARALAAWDRYLDAAPTGRFAPEARYNRALALVRLGRRVEAQKELAVFANGMYGDYRREDARALLDALAREASRP